jgi:hypothetical protein
MRSGKQMVGMAVILAILLFPIAAAAESEMDMLDEPQTATAGYITVDVFAARPVGIVSTLFGAATFVLSSPFAALGGNLEQSFDELVEKPFNYTFKRPIGVF